MEITFIWNPEKAKINRQKHRISFMEAQTVFADQYAVVVSDEWHSDEEEREIIIGHSEQNRLLFVVFVERELFVVRIISARLATKKERQDYERYIQEN